MRDHHIAKKHDARDEDPAEVALANDTLRLLAAGWGAPIDFLAHLRSEPAETDTVVPGTLHVCPGCGTPVHVDAPPEPSESEVVGYIVTYGGPRDLSPVASREVITLTEARVVAGKLTEINGPGYEIAPVLAALTDGGGGDG